MKTLHEIFESGGQSSAPYNTALKVVVCGIGQIVQYRNASGDQRESVTVGLLTNLWQQKEHCMT